ncbi:heme exporter protein CcmB [Alkalilimnicola ehrlichii MLHE-1]|uniref:Heme exporter protein B n=1 Tax=Alkalilimnicola ehrlichii (strain ATCC BAA-1101 / DSM 17681 / MLHE-1) TaxID=187272 RepID=Q0A807_ALKEH|nr:heme exporter protein CcmB [Alkalilimnicola ehrlichii]ABI57030.1 heme exporter protein CcmB [Alkalilimnicola ehrlichii MLHE-1]
MFQAFIALLHRDLTLVMRRRQDALYGMAFFVIVVSLFPLGMGPEPALLQRIAPGAIWAAALLASLLTLERLFADDCGEHTLESLLLAPQPLSLLVLAKLVAHWLYAGLPLVVIAPLLGLQLGLAPAVQLTLVVSLLLGTPVLTLLGGIAAALTLGARAGNGLMALVLLPLFVPVLILGSGAVEQSLHGASPQGHLLLLAALLVLALSLAPAAIAAALRIALD